MAKNKDDAKEEKEEKKKKGKGDADAVEDDGEEKLGGKLLLFFVTLLIIAIWLAIICLLIKMDVGGFGSSVLYPIFKDVPVINQILPEVTEYEDGEDPYAFDSVDDAVVRIKELEAELAAAQSGDSDDAASISELESQVAELQTYKEQWEEFQTEREKFYDEVVFSDVAPDISNYQEYYESINPSYAETLYKQVVQQEQKSEELEDYIETYSKMKPKEAAAIFDTMTDNLQLVADILSGMDTSARGDILGKMSSDTAAKVTEIMEPEN